MKKQKLVFLRMIVLSMHAEIFIAEATLKSIPSISDKILWTKYRNLLKFDRTREFVIYFCVFFGWYCQSFLSGKWIRNLAIFARKFDIFSIFPNSQRPSVSNCSAACGKNTFTESVILDIKLRFTCVESNLY